MRTLLSLRTRFPKLTRALASTLVIGALGGIATYAEHARAADSCCGPGSPCCFPGSPCCAGNHAAK